MTETTRLDAAARDRPSGESDRRAGSDFAQQERRLREPRRDPIEPEWRRRVRTWNPTPEDVDEVLHRQAYRFAKTMPDAPHWYTLRNTWEREREELFGLVVTYIRMEGLPQVWTAPSGRHQRWGTYMYLGEWKYWTMGSPVEGTKLINCTNVENGGAPLRRPDARTLEALGCTAMLEHLRGLGLLGPGPGDVLRE